MTQYIFFSGKGGVGKTTMAATTAVYEAKQGKRTLLVSTDPAGNLGDIFEKDITTEPREYSKNLFVAQMDSHAITEAYKDKMLAPLAEILDGLALEQVKEEFNSGCTVEIATFDKFTDFLADQSYDLIVFDTAPTGHTLRLMTLPGEWNQFILKSAQGSGQTCIGPVSQIEGLINRMKNPEEASFLLVAYPEFTPLHESHRAMKDLERVGIDVQGVLLNHILQQDDCPKGFAQQRWKLQQHYLNQAAGLFEKKPLFAISLQSTEINGIEKIKELSEIVFNQ